MSNLFVSQKPWSEQTFEEHSGTDLVTSLIELSKLRGQIEIARKALKEIDRIAYSKKAGAVRNMQVTARTALKDITP